MEDENEKDITKKKFNIIVLGEQSVGKTSVISRLKGKKFEDTTLSTAGIDYYIDEKTFDGIKYKFKIFDTAGQERYKSIAGSTIKLADGFIIVYAVNNPKSFEQVQYWIDTIEEGTDLKKKPSVLLANKIDLERSVTKEEGEEFAKSKSITYSETSAKTGLNIKETFDNLYNNIFQLKGKGKGSFDIRRMSKPKAKKSSFC
jgi:small GTP-binding protein